MKVFEWNKTYWNQPAILTPKTDIAFHAATKCYYCGIEFDGEKYYEHDYLSEESSNPAKSVTTAWELTTTFYLSFFKTMMLI